MRYRFLGYPDQNFPNLKHGQIYTLVVVTAFWSGKPRIVKPFYCPYNSWKAFYRNWRPMTMDTVRLENSTKLCPIDKRKKANYN